jgi:DNA-binding MarR family transcriptional regulator
LPYFPAKGGQRKRRIIQQLKQTHRTSPLSGNADAIPGRGWATISELAEFLQERHNAVAGLVQRVERAGLVRKSQPTRDRRFVRVHLTPPGWRLLTRITRLHVKEIDATRNASPLHTLAVMGSGRASHGESTLKRE